MEHLSSDHRGESQRIERMVREINSSSRSPWAGAALVAGVFAVVLGSQLFATPGAQNPQQRFAKAIDQGADLNKLLEPTAAGYADTFHSQFRVEIVRLETTELPPTF